MQKVSVVPVQIIDVPQVAQIEKECFAEPWSEKNILNSLKNDKFYMIAVKLDDKVLGYGGMYFVADEGYICNVAVSRNARGQGFGKIIVNKLIECSRSKNLSFLSLEVRASNSVAINLYAGLGFVNVGVRKNFYTSPSENAIIMTKKLI